MKFPHCAVIIIISFQNNNMNMNTNMNMNGRRKRRSDSQKIDAENWKKMFQNNPTLSSIFPGLNLDGGKHSLFELVKVGNTDKMANCSTFLSEAFDDESSRMTMLEKFHTSFDKCQTFHGLKPVCQDEIIQTSWDHLRNYLKTEDVENCGNDLWSDIIKIQHNSIYSKLK